MLRNDLLQISKERLRCAMARRKLDDGRISIRADSRLRESFRCVDEFVIDWCIDFFKIE